MLQQAIIFTFAVGIAIVFERFYYYNNQRLENLQSEVNFLKGKLSELGYYTKAGESSTLNQWPTDCKDVYSNGQKTNGVYRIYPKGNVNGFDVYCDMRTDGGGWTVIQRRSDGSVDFYRTWNEYRDGFGDVSGEFWLGNERIYEMTSKHEHTLRIDLMDHDGERKYATYEHFSISNSKSGYRLSVGKYSGDAGDAMKYHLGMTFKTKDNDDSIEKCATKYEGAWWYDGCHHSNLNGVYWANEHGKGVTWYQWHGWEYSLKSAEMKIRRI